MNNDSHARLYWWMHAFPRIAGATAIIAGLIVIAGWILELAILKSLHPSLVSMKANTAITFVLAGMSLLLYSFSGGDKQGTAARFAGLLVFLVGLLNVAQYAFAWDAGIDQLLFKEPEGTIGTFSPGRMALNSAVNFSLFGLALLTFKKRAWRGDGLAHMLALAVALSSLLGLLAYTFGVSEFSGYAVYTRMALHTAVTFILLSIGFICLQPDIGVTAVIRGTGSGGFMARRLLPAAVVMPVVIGWLTTEGENHGLYGNQFGDVIAAAAYIAIALVLIWRTSRSLNMLEVERKRVEKELQESEKHFKELFDNAPVGYHELDAEGRITRINQTELRTLGYRSDEMLSHFAWEFVTNKQESQNAVSAKLSGTLPPAKGVERIFIRKDGTTITVIIEDQLLLDTFGQIIGIRTTLQDVTELKRAQEQLRESEEKHRTVLDNLAEGVGIVDGEERFRFANPAAETIFGVPAGSLVGRSLREFMDPEEFEKMAEQTTNRRKGETASYEIQFTRADGAKRDLFVTVSPFIENDRDFVGSIGVFRDLTERKRAERLTGALYGISQAIHSTNDLNELFEHIHRDLLNIMPAKNFFIALLSGDGRMLSFPYGNDEKDNIWPDINADDPHSLTVEVLQSKRPLLLDEKELHNRYSTGRNKVWGSMPKCWLGVPLITGEKTIGVMAVQDYDRGDAYGPKDVGLIEMAAGQIAIAIERKRAEQERELIITELTAALENVKTLGGLVPICAHCKKIRDDKGYWNQLEKYLGDHTDAKLTHGLCPDCTKVYFPDSAVGVGGGS